MSIANFLKNYGKTKAEDLSEGIVTLAATIDASGVSEAAIKQKQDEHNELVRQLVDAKADFEREKKEYDAEQAVYNKKMAAAERAQADLEADPNNADAAAALTELLDSIEKHAPKLDKEKREYDQASAWLADIQAAADEVAKELLGLREQIDNAKLATKQAELDLAQATKQKQQAETLAGLRRSSNKFDVAMNALQKQATEKQKEADAARIAAEQLRKPVETVSTAASKYLEGASEVSTETLQERLARLKK